MVTGRLVAMLASPLDPFQLDPSGNVTVADTPGHAGLLPPRIERSLQSGDEGRVVTGSDHRRASDGRRGRRGRRRWVRCRRSTGRRRRCSDRGRGSTRCRRAAAIEGLAAAVGVAGATAADGRGGWRGGPPTGTGLPSGRRDAHREEHGGRDDGDDRRRRSDIDRRPRGVAMFGHDTAGLARVPSPVVPLLTAATLFRQVDLLADGPLPSGARCRPAVPASSSSSSATRCRRPRSTSASSASGSSGSRA